MIASHVGRRRGDRGSRGGGPVACEMLRVDRDLPRRGRVFGNGGLRTRRTVSGRRSPSGSCPPAVSQKHAANDVHLPQLHRSAAFPPAEPSVPALAGVRIDELGASQHPVDGRTRRNGLDACACGLVHEPTGPHSGLRRRASSTQASMHGSIWCAHRGRTVRTVGKTGQALVLVPPQPPGARPGGRRRSGGPPRRSGLHRASPRAVLGTSAPRHSAPATCLGVSRIRRNRCNASPGADVSRVRRNSPRIR
jgi:hypothetical protein